MKRELVLEFVRVIEVVVFVVYKWVGRGKKELVD